MRNIRNKSILWNEKCEKEVIGKRMGFGGEERDFELNLKGFRWDILI